MSFLDRVLGRSRPPAPSLDQLFALPGAALTLEAATGLRPTGLGSVAYREAEGAAATGVRRDVQALLDADGGPAVERSVDTFGYTWLLVRERPAGGRAGGQHEESGADADSADVSGLVTDLHAVNAGLVDAGFGSTLLCSLLGFAGDGRRLGLIYLYKRGTFYPFAPTGEAGNTRDSAFELQVRAALGSDLPVEADVSRWFPVWGAPGL